MSLVSGLQGGLVSGLKGGFNSLWGPRKILDLDFSEPVTQPFVTANATHEWHLQETSSVYADSVGTDDLTVNGTWHRGQKAVGLWTGAAFDRLAAESQASAGSGDYLEAASTAVLDADDSFGVRVVFRGQSGHAVGAIGGKRSGASPTVGWWMRVSDTALQFHYWDGTTEKIATLTANHMDGAWHYADFVYDATAQEIRIRSDLGTATPVDVSALSSVSSSHKFRIGSIFGTNARNQLQIAYVAGIEGSNAESMDSESFWLHGNDPTGKLDTITRASLISDVCGSDADGDLVGHWSGEPSTPQLPFGWDTDFTHTTKLGLRCAAAVTNLNTYSENFASGTGWATTNATDTAADIDSPDGFRNGTKVVQDAADGYISHTWSGLTVDGTFNVNLWVRVPSDHPSDTVRMRLSGIGGGPDTTFSKSVTSDKWVRIEQTVTLTGGASQLRLIFYPSDATEQDHCWIWGCMVVEAAEMPGPYVRTNGASASSAQTNYSLTNTNNRYLDNAQGDFEITYTLDNTTVPFGVDNVIADLVDSGNNNRWVLYADAAERLELVTFNTVGGTEYNVQVTPVLADWSGELNQSARWQTDGKALPGLSGKGAECNDGVSTQDAATRTYATAVATDLRLGRNRLDSPALNGLFKSIKVWDGPKR